jgi:hypothetical protein
MEECFDYAMRDGTVYPTRTRRRKKRKEKKRKEKVKNPSSRLVLTLWPILLNLFRLSVRLPNQTSALVCEKDTRLVIGAEHLFKLVFRADLCEHPLELAHFLQLLLVSSGSGDLLLCGLLFESRLKLCLHVIVTIGDRRRAALLERRGGGFLGRRR